MLRIELLGTSFSIQSDEQPEYVAQLVEHLRSRIDRIEGSVATGDPLKKAILAALLVTDELFAAREKQDPNLISTEDLEEVHDITTRILAHIDESLPGQHED